MTGAGRLTAVAGSFYPDDPGALRALVRELLDDAARLPDAPDAPTDPLGLLVPHAGLVYSGVVAAAAWRRLGAPGAGADAGAATVVLLSTNHGAGWLDGVGTWEAGRWELPTGAVPVDEALAAAIVALGPPFLVDRSAHAGEHSIEVQLPLLAAVAPAIRVVPLAVSAGTGPEAIDAGERLGQLLGGWPGRVVLAISTDMAHYPRHADCARVTEELREPILAADAAELAAREDAVCGRGIPGLLCGMCGIQPAVLGMAALRAMGASRGVTLASATSADAGGSPGRTVGYLAVAWGR